jgi:hypothetical protein
MSKLQIITAINAMELLFWSINKKQFKFFALEKMNK